MVTMLASAATVHCSSSRDTFSQPEPAPPPPVSPFVDADVPEADIALQDRDCSNENKQIYVFTSEDTALYRFDPSTLTFTLIAKVKCPSTASAYSMAVDRHGTAWAEYHDGRIFQVSTEDGTCVESGFRPNQLGFSTFGMGFAKNEPDGGAGVSAGETLYVAGDALGRIDTTSLELTLVGSASFGKAELTGTGAGTLYAFIPNGGRIARLDKTTGAIQEIYRPDVVVGSAWAFAQWGGDFWLFTASGGPTSSVTRYSPSTDTAEVVIPDTGMTIVGAGVSTCAPTEPPH